MEQLEVINKIKTREEEAQRIIEEARLKASSIIKEAKFIKREEILNAAKEEALREIQRFKEDFRLKLQEMIKKQEQQMQQNIDKIKILSPKNKNRARDYIVDEVLKSWQLQR